MHGIGRLTQEQVAEIGKEDLRAISNCLGEKKYLMGDNPTKVCTTLRGSDRKYLKNPIQCWSKVSYI